jgi:LysM repeat protein
MAERFYFRGMKRFALLFAGATILAGQPLLSQDTAPAAVTAAEAAAQQDAEERYKRLNAAVEDLIAAQAAQQKKFLLLAEDLKSLREEMTRNAGNNSTRDDLRTLAEKVAELDKQRQADKELILGEIKKLAKVPVASPRGAGSEPKPHAEPKPDLPSKGAEYTVRDGDTLSTIIANYRKAGVKVTRDMVMKANPKLDPNQIFVGQKIFIPVPE